MGLKETIQEVNKAIEKSKTLTTKDRKNLKKSVYCGPRRSFPCPDCRHVASAKAYLNRSNFSKSTKAKIAACINRKGRQLGCSKGKPAKVKGSFDDVRWKELTVAEQVIADSEIFETTRELVRLSIEDENFTLDWNEVEEQEDPRCSSC